MNIEKSFPCHKIPGEYIHYHSTLLQGCRKRNGKNLGRRNRESTTNGHQLARPE